MANQHFRFKQFNINQERAAFKVGTDGVLLGAWADVKGVKKVLDIGTGSGLIALMIAQRCDARIVAIEPDESSYNQAVDNRNKSRWVERIAILNTDFQSYCSGKTELFDLIISNPPFFSNSLKNPDTRKSNTRHNELLPTDDLLSGASKLLEDSGKLILVLPYAEGNMLIAAASGYGLFCNNMLKVKSQPSAPVGRLLLEFGKVKVPLKEKFLTIESGGRHVYSEEYIELTRDFYLYF